jgi:CheY-specific phosphatase CheX
MAQDPPPTHDLRFPYSSLVRSADRAGVLNQVVDSVWDTALGLRLSAVDDVPTDPGQRTRTAAVEVTGAWRGTVAMTAEAALADECATRMYKLPLDRLSQSEIQDSWGEICNMITGNLKALVKSPSRISLPAVTDGDGFTFRSPGFSLYNELTYACHGHRLRVTVLRAEPETATADPLKPIDQGGVAKPSKPG